MVFDYNVQLVSVGWTKYEMPTICHSCDLGIGGQSGWTSDSSGQACDDSFLIVQKEYENFVVSTFLLLTTNDMRSFRTQGQHLFAQLLEIEVNVSRGTLLFIAMQPSSASIEHRV